MNIIEKDYSWAHELSARQVTNLIILHHAAAKSCTVSDVHNWHLNRGWAGIGYHFFVGKDGSIVRGRPLWAVGAHAESCNWRSVGICFEGDYQIEETMPDAQLQAGPRTGAVSKGQTGRGLRGRSSRRRSGGHELPWPVFPVRRDLRGGRH